MATPVNQRPILRQAIEQHIKTASELQAFLLDYFPRTAHEIAAGMDRTAQVNLLLTREPEDAIGSALEAKLGHDAQAVSQLRARLGLLPVAAAMTNQTASPMAPAVAGGLGAQTAPRLLLPTSYVLHLSDLHFCAARQVVPWLDFLEADLEQIRRDVPRLDAVVVSGDLTQTAAPQEFAAAAEFLRELLKTYALKPPQLVLVPGNHDGSWKESQAAYDADRPSVVAVSEVLHAMGHRFVPSPAKLAENKKTREALYEQRFAAFAEFYQEVCGQSYPLDFARQATLHPFPDQKLLFVGLNSAWECDHLAENRGRASINTDALSPVLRTLRREPTYKDWLKIAVWHHPIQSAGEDRLKNTGFLDRLAQAGFRLGLHGHLHAAQLSQHSYDVVADGRRIDLVGAGTFGAPTKEWQSGVPLQYQLLRIEGAQAKVLSRCRDNPQGPWRGDGRWVVGAEARTYYEITL